MARPAEKSLSPNAARYEVLAPTYLDRIFDVVGAEIVWEGTPNKALLPLNDAAKAAVEKEAGDRAARSPLVVAGLSTSSVPLTADAPKAADLASMRKRAEEAEFKLLERDEDIVKLKAELQAVTDERNALKAGKPDKPSDAK